jgi:hypothetical protein
VIEPYRVGIAIYMSGPIAEQMATMSEQMKSYQTIVNAANSSLKEMGASIAAISRNGASIAAQWRGIANDMERAARAAGGLNAATGATRGAAAASAGIGGAPVPDYREPSSPYATGPRRLLLSGPSGLPDPYYRNWNAGGGGGVVPYAGGGGAGGGGGGALTGGGIPLNPGPMGGIGVPPLLPTAVIDYGAFEIAKGSFDQAVLRAQAESGLAHQGMTPEQIADAVDRSYKTMTSVKGTSLLGNLSIISAAMGVTQDPEESMKMLPGLAQLQVNLGSVGHAKSAADMMDVVRSGDFLAQMSSRNPTTGKMDLDLAKFKNFTDLVTAADAASHGGFGPKELLAFLRGGAPSTALLDNSEIFGPEIAMSIALGSSKAGTAIRAFQQQFGGGKGGEAATNLLIELGIINGGGVVKKDEHAKGANPFTRKIGVGQSVLLPGAMSPEDMKLATENPSAFITKAILPAMEKWLSKTYGTAYTQGDDKTKIMYEGNLATQLSARYPAATEIIEVLRNRFAIERESAAVQKELGVNQSAISNKNPQVNIDAFTSSWLALQASFGTPIMPTIISDMNALTSVFNSMAIFAKDHAAFTGGEFNTLFIALGGFTTLAVGGVLAKAATGLDTLGLSIKGFLGPILLLGTLAQEVNTILVGLQEVIHKYVPWVNDPKFNNPEDALKHFQETHPDMKPIVPAPGVAPDPNDPYGHPSMLPPLVAHPDGLYHPTSYAPDGSGTGSGGAMPVYVINPVQIGNGRDLIRGISSGQADLMNRPPPGYTPSDPRISPAGAYYGKTEAA